MSDCCIDTGNLGFHGIESYDETDFITELQYNLKVFLDYSFLKIGAWNDVVVDSGVGNCEQDLTVLNELTTPSSYSYKLWGAIKKDWVWEDIEYEGASPLGPVIYVDDEENTDLFDINYPLGMISGSNVISSDVVITATYSYRKIQVYLADQAGWWHELLNATFSTERDAESIKSQIFSIFRDSVQPPAIILESGGTRMEPAMLGTTAHWVYQDIVFNIVSEDSTTRDKIVSILTRQKDNSLMLFNSDEATFPLGCNGEILNSNNYPNIVSDAPWRCGRIVQTGTATFESPCPGLHFGRVRMTFEILSPNKPKVVYN